MKRALLAFAALSTYAAVSASAAQADTYKIGLVADFTGIFATWGTQFQQAVQAFQADYGKSVKVPQRIKNRIPKR